MTSMLTLRALRLEVGKPAEVIELSDSAEALHGAIGGRPVRIPALIPLGHDRTAAIWMDADGRARGLKPNRLVIVEGSGLRGVVQGPIVVLASDGTEEPFALSADEAAHVERLAEGWPVVRL